MPGKTPHHAAEPPSPTSASSAPGTPRADAQRQAPQSSAAWPPDRRTGERTSRHGQFVSGEGGSPQWAPGLGEWVADTSRARVGVAIAWDGPEGEVTLRAPEGGEPWVTRTFRRASARETLDARVTMLNRKGFTC